MPFDPRTQSEAFTVSLEGLKGVRLCSFLNLASAESDFNLQWNIHALVPESSQAREDRKKRVRAGVADHLRLVQFIYPFLLFTERTQKIGESSGLCCPPFGWHPFALDSYNDVGASATTCATTTHEHPHPSSPWRQTRIRGQFSRTTQRAGPGTNPYHIQWQWWRISDIESSTKTRCSKSGRTRRAASASQEAARCKLQFHLYQRCAEFGGGATQLARVYM